MQQRTRMRKLIGRWVSVFVVLVAVAANGQTTATQPSGEQTTASRVFATASPSIVVVKAFDSQGKAIAQGSGVVIAKGIVVSNCHIFRQAGTKSASVLYHDKRYPAALRYADPAHDLCSFTVKGLGAPPVPMRNATSLKVGENTYAIGAPEGLNLTLSSGLVSGLREAPDGTVIQTTAPISPGSSGGGLFDGKGRLIGITSYYLKGSQQLNFSLPVKWVKALPQRGQNAERLAKLSYELTPELLTGMLAELNSDYAAALSCFKKLAEQGNTVAQGQLAWMYTKGNGVSQDYTKAAYWYRKAAAHGFAEAQYNLGAMYYHGRGVPHDYTEALHWYEKAAEQGVASAQASLGTMYDDGHGVAQNYAKAVRWYSIAAERGLAAAQVHIGLMYYDGHGVSQDYATAVRWFHKAAEQGDAQGQFNVGQMYRKGQGVIQDYVKAARWYRESAEQGLPEAQFSLGLMYERGIGVVQDATKAAHWYREAAEHGSASAQTNLGIIYATGIGVPRDDTQAVYWFQKAAEQGHSLAQAKLGAMYALGDGVPQDYLQAAKWITLAKTNGDHSADKLLPIVTKYMTASQIAEAKKLAREWWTTHHKDSPAARTP